MNEQNDWKDLAEIQQVTIDNQKAEIERLRSIIRRAEVKFFEDGSDRTAAANMLTVLHEAKL